MSKPTYPLPWNATTDGLLQAANGKPLAVFGAPESSPSRKDVQTAAHVALAVNSFHPLVDALRGALGIFGHLSSCPAWALIRHPGFPDHQCSDECAAARAALEMAGYPVTTFPTEQRKPPE